MFSIDILNTSTVVLYRYSIHKERIKTCVIKYFQHDACCSFFIYVHWNVLLMTRAQLTAHNFGFYSMFYIPEKSKAKHKNTDWHFNLKHTHTHSFHNKLYHHTSCNKHKNPNFIKPIARSKKFLIAWFHEMITFVVPNQNIHTVVRVLFV